MLTKSIAGTGTRSDNQRKRQSHFGKKGKMYHGGIAIGFDDQKQKKMGKRRERSKTLESPDPLMLIYFLQPPLLRRHRITTTDPTTKNNTNSNDDSTKTSG